MKSKCVAQATWTIRRKYYNIAPEVLMGLCGFSFFVFFPSQVAVDITGPSRSDRTVSEALVGGFAMHVGAVQA
jgi:hypothetical protein